MDYHNIDLETIFLIQPIEGYSPQISHLLSMMNYARFTTLNSVKGLRLEHLDYLHDENSNTIGALLQHAAAVERIYQHHTFEGEAAKVSDEEHETRWKAALNLGDEGRKHLKGKTLEELVAQLHEVRSITLAELKKCTDDWLYEATDFWNEKKANNYFKWFHVYEDEINHRGQIRWIRSRALKAFPNTTKEKV